jgi:hypothetical protein
MLIVRALVTRGLKVQTCITATILQPLALPLRRLLGETDLLLAGDIALYNRYPLVCQPPCAL